MNIVRNSPIAIIDSGIGGISLLKQITKKYPGENYIYLADNEYMPYGNKSATFLKNRLLELVKYLVDTFNVKMVILACHTASVVSLKYIKNNVDIPVLGLNLNDYNAPNHKIICTKLTAKKYTNLEVCACPRLAGIIEDNIFDMQTLKRRIAKTLDRAEIGENNIVLGCTHYELVANVFNQLYPNKNFVLPCKEFVNNLSLDKPNGATKGDILMLSTLATKSYIDKLWKIFKQ